MISKTAFLGLMAGTSADGVDVVLVNFHGPRPQLRDHLGLPYPSHLRRQVLSIAHCEQDHLDAVATLDVELGRFYADACLALLARSAADKGEIAAIGSHGQTVRHRPSGPAPFTWQLGDPNIIAQRTGITTVADFRRRDMAAGGQGAPLLPAFHAACLRSTSEDRVVLNIGGIANITLLPKDPDLAVTGFDTGPGNALLDEWINRCNEEPLDAGGLWAASGEIHFTLLERLLSDPYFRLAPPKSTGREYFNLAWLDSHLRTLGQPVEAAATQATLCELTVRTIAAAIVQFAPTTDRILACGGGVRNNYLMERLRANLAGISVQTTAEFGLDPQCVEAMAFAWLAGKTLRSNTGNLPSVTGAAEAVILGAIYPANPVPTEKKR